MKNPLEIAGGGVSIFCVPLKTPFITALGRKTVATNVGLTVRLRNGVEGYGEASGSVVMAHLTPEKSAGALKKGLRNLIGRDVRNRTAMIQEAWERTRSMASAAAALECAVTDALVQSLGVKMSEWLGGAASALRTDLTISAADPGESQKAARDAMQEGFSQLKIKIGTGAADWPRVLAVWQACRRLGRKPNIMLDGNQSMTASSALRLVEACLKNDIPVVLLEQPLPARSVAAMAKLKRRCPAPLAADESVRSPREALEVLDRDAADVINVKVAKTGIQDSLAIIALALAAKKKLMIGCMQETARGLSASVHLACGVGAFDFVDLDSDLLLVPGQPKGDFRREGPWLRLN